MAKKVEEKKTVYWIDFSRLDGRDPATFIATEIEVRDDGFVRAVGSYRRKKAVITLLISKSCIINIEESSAVSEEEQAEEQV